MVFNWFKDRVLTSMPSRSCVLILIILSAIPLTSAVNIAFNSVSFKILSAILAPCDGGLEYIGLIIILTCDSTRAASSALAQTTEKAPVLWP